MQKNTPTWASLRPSDFKPGMPTGTDFTDRKTMGVCAEQMVQKFKVSREDSNIQKLLTTRIIFRKDGVITVAGSSRFTDASVALLDTSLDAANKLGLQPFAEADCIHSPTVVAKQTQHG
ncbi:MAG: hypothetical protein KJ798_10560 [Gammaproteobacteria bacterium]|uniref:hypothetical protein n=1 Tax=Limnobacter sp. TaxID=2003368 RepID=UPI001D6B8BA9|nr:hypothetical protein [Limnobacter sp.]MBU0782631.1 hypothetical protein [Gammaproteobacteria bacterium]MBU0850219.1 hypothetical protein [Gammaproteobacteria bacterium]MBU1266285.1 hypothetical protein [Gammaproteobacteria bacterium]MBU1528627.1 hypothetical protein [Gammaproteobacteria bacterium]MBU1780810.1 hypothetical protein [Gammaproteobacteria bacterium]